MSKFKPGDRVVANVKGFTGAATSANPGDKGTVGERYTKDQWITIIWDKPQRQMDGGYNPEDFDFLVESVDDLIAQKTAAIAEAQSIIDAAKAEIKKLQQPQVGDKYYNNTHGSEKQATFEILMIEEDQAFCRITNAYPKAGMYSLSFFKQSHISKVTS